MVGVLLALVILAEFLRIRAAPLNRLFVRLFGALLKEAEGGRPTGVPFFLGGLLVSLLLFDRSVALAALIILSIGDPAAAMVGRRWGRIRLGAKSLEGTAAFAIAAVSAVALLGLFWPVPAMPVYVLGAILGAGAELMPGGVNDNLTIPLLAGLGMELATRIGSL